MGTISSSVGLISGINIQELVAKLMAIEARPLNQLKTRITEATQIKTAYTELVARFLSAKGVAGRLAKSDAFTVRKATSSNEDVLTATATKNTPLDTYSFLVKNLVSTHQLVSAGYTSRDATIGAGTLTFETGRGNVAPTTLLADLNGIAGVRRGIIRITDRSGAAADVDLRTATNLQEVLDAINRQSTARVTAAIEGDHLVLTDQTGLATGSLTVADLNGGFTAADLGIAGTGAGQIVGTNLVSLVNESPLSRLNDGNGVRVDGINDDLRFTLRDGRQVDVNLSGVLRFSTNLAELNDGRGVRLGTIRLTNRAGQTAQVDLSGAQTLQDVVNAINSSGVSVTASLSSSRIILSDTSGGTTSNFKVEDVSGFAAADLGIVADVAAGGITGGSIYRVDSLGAVLRAIQYATGNDGALSAAISPDKLHLVLTDNTVGAGTSSIEALNDSRAIEDLGLTGDFSSGTITSLRLKAGLNTVLLSSLNGGQGVDTTSLSIDRTVGGATATVNVDLAGVETLQGVVEKINAYRDGSNQQAFRAQVANGGTSLIIQDIAGGQIAAVGGTAATDLHLAVASDGAVAGGDLQLRYIGENTLLSSLNAGRGVALSSFRIASSTGLTATITLSASQKTVGDVLKAINAAAIGVTASINSTGDGILLTDTAGGAGKLQVTENGGTTAADLNLLGTAEGTTIDGALARRIEVTAGDTLDTLVTKINESSAGLRASIINDGSAIAPYRLIISSSTTGAIGRVNFSLGSTWLSLSTLSDARDAKIVVGSIDSPSSVVLTSGSNTVKNVVDGLTLDLKAAGSQPVDVTVARDVDQVVSDIGSFVETINDTLDRIDDLTQYIPETQERGILLGDSAVQQTRDRIFSLVSGSATGQGLTYRRLSQVGITVGSGARLQFDEDRFREAFEADPEGVEKLFTLTSKNESGKVTKHGFAARLEDVIDGLTQTGTGLLSQKADDTQDRIDLFNRRAQEMQKLLDIKEARLYAQFQAMETALAALQSQQSALASLSSLASSLASSSSFNLR